MNDPLENMSADELVVEATKHVLTALAALDGLRRALREKPVLSQQERLNAVRFSAGPTCRTRVRKVDQPRSPRQRGAFPRGVE